MPKLLIKSVYHHPNAYGKLRRSRDGKCLYTTNEVMKTRSGLSIKKIPCSYLKHGPINSTDVLPCSDLISQGEMQGKSKRRTYRMQQSLSIVTRYKLLFDGVEIGANDDLTFSNQASLFIASNNHLNTSLDVMGLSLPAEHLQDTPLKLFHAHVSVSETAQQPPHTLKKEQLCFPEVSESEAISTVLMDFRDSSETATNLLAKALKYNINFEGQNNLYKCKVCRKIYGGLMSFSEHINSHVKLKNKCHVCGRMFTRSWLLKGHMRIHTGEKPYKCLECGKAFADKSNLRSHMLIHTVTTKAHQCNKCGKAFAQRRYLHKHSLEVCK